MPNRELTPKTDVSSFRKIAIGTWQHAYDPSVYGTMEIRMDAAVRYLSQYRAATGRKVTVTHLIAKAAAEALREVPDANAVLRWNRVYLRKTIGVFFQVAMTDEGPGKIDLSGATLYDVDKKSLGEIYDEFQSKVDKVRKRQDPALEKTRGAMKDVPFMLMNTVMKALGFLTVNLNLDLTAFGIPNDPFGSIMVTNVGSIGLDTAYVPLVPYSGVPILLAVGNVRDVPVVENGKVVPAKVMKVNATFDHRFIDGFHAAVMSRVIKRWLENPEECFGRVAAESRAG